MRTLRHPSRRAASRLVAPLAVALPRLRAMAKVSISTVVVVGKKEILKSGKLYDESVDMQVVIKSAIDKAAAQAERSLCLVKAEAFVSYIVMEGRGTELDTDDLPDITVKHLHDHFG